ncbi:MAG: L-2-hydroxyglutarate oxidase [Desulfobacterales bacterium]|nr:L-2-hydroxyglutarate oxidase [Desulfobacterales bacterium]
MINTNVIICGSGIVGLTIARELSFNGVDDILIIEKEDFLGKHASGRNSGVLHAGIYYQPLTKRADSCLSGNLMMQAYCLEKGLPLKKTGKVIVACDETEHNTLKELYKRAVKNGADVVIVDEKELSDIEPNAKTCEMAIYSRNTAVVEPQKILLSLFKDIISNKKTKIMFGTKFIGLSKDKKFVLTTKGNIGFNFFINAAGAYSDIVAHSFGIGHNYKLIPFKGIYRKLKKEKSNIVKGNVYPIPNIRNPFLGVHFTRNTHGDVYIGPTAIPGFGRENYGIFKGIDKECFEILLRDANLFLANSKFRNVALTEILKYNFSYFYKDAKKLLKQISPLDIEGSTKVGIRPQLVNIHNNELVMDFLVEKGDRSIHILNSISPAFTSSMYFSKIVVSEFIKSFKL